VNAGLLGGPFCVSYNFFIFLKIFFRKSAPAANAAADAQNGAAPAVNAPAPAANDAQDAAVVPIAPIAPTCAWGIFHESLYWWRRRTRARFALPNLQPDDVRERMPLLYALYEEALVGFVEEARTAGMVPPPHYNARTPHHWLTDEPALLALDIKVQHGEDGTRFSICHPVPSNDATNPPSRLDWLDWHCFGYGIRCIYSHGVPPEVHLGVNGVLNRTRRQRMRNFFAWIAGHSEVDDQVSWSVDMTVILDDLESFLSSDPNAPVENRRTKFPLAPLPQQHASFPTHFSWGTQTWMPRVYQALVRVFHQRLNVDFPAMFPNPLQARAVPAPVPNRPFPY